LKFSRSCEDSSIPVDLFFEVSKDGRTRGHTLKLVKHRSDKDLRHHFFSERVVYRWNQLDKDAVEATSLNSFKNCLAKLRNRKMGFSWTSVCRALWLEQVLHLVQPHQVYDQVYMTPQVTIVQSAIVASLACIPYRPTPPCRRSDFSRFGLSPF